METNNHQIANECTSDDDGNPACNNWIIKHEILDGVWSTYLEACDECRKEMGEIHYEEMEEENEVLLDDNETLMRKKAEAAERVEQWKSKVFIMYVKRQNLLMNKFIRDIGL